jgi:tetratricopeptide (TPR) repeat protein
MYLRTPKRYRPSRRPKRYVFSTRWLWLWIVTPLAVIIGTQLYDQRSLLVPQVNQALNSVVSSAGDSLATVTAPTALPTEDPREMIRRGDAAWGRGAIEEAIDAYAAALPGAPNDARLHYLYTFGLLMEGRTSEALEAAETTITANPFVADAWAIRALAQTRNGQSAAAIASALQALSLDPTSARALAFMAEAYYDADQPARATETSARALEANPESFEALYVSALLNWYVEIDWEAALADFEAAYERAPNLPYIAIDMAWMLYQFERYDDGLLLLEEVVDRNPNNLDALYALGFYYNAVYGDTERALDYMSRCVAADDGNVPCLSYLGTLQSVVDLEAALGTYRRLIEVGTTNPRHYLDAGRVNIANGDCNAALPLLRQGYSMEQLVAQPNPDRLALFEELLGDCGLPAAGLPPPADATSEANTVPEQITLPGS